MRLFVVSICFGLFGFASVADVIKFKNGDILSGTLTGISGGHVTFKIKLSPLDNMFPTDSNLPSGGEIGLRPAF